MTRHTEAFRSARTCYDHLAGRLGVAVTRALRDRGVIRRSAGGFTVTAKGEHWLEGFGIDAGALEPRQRPSTRACLDLTERRDHLAGALGAAIASRLLGLGWIERCSEPRALRLTPAGRAGLLRTLGLDPVAEKPARGN